MSKIVNGAEVNFGAIVEMIARYGFTRVERIDRVGEFSVRGDVVDIWCPRQKHPTRIMFFGDTVEAIKAVKIGDFSAVKNLEEVRILPFDGYVLIKRPFTTLSLPPRHAMVHEQFLSKFHPDTPADTLVYHRERGLGRYIGRKVLELGDTKRAYYIVQYSKSSVLYVPTDAADDVLFNYCGHSRKLDHI